jgi:hypothetical protein
MSRRRCPSIVLHCLYCRAKLSTLALEDQLKDGRIICSYCRRAERGMVERPGMGAATWLDIVALAALCGLAWAALYFL